MPKTTALLRVPFFMGIYWVLTPSPFRKSRINSPTLSLPTAVSRLAFTPNLAQPTAIFRGEPPTKASNPFISLKEAPISWEYRSMDDLPKVMTSYFLLPIYLLVLFISAVTNGNLLSFEVHEPYIHPWPGSVVLARH